MENEKTPIVKRTGVYGVVIENGKLLTVIEENGPYAGMHALPGGGIEFGESVEEALRREFLEEVEMAFSSCEWLGNWTHVHDAPQTLNRNAFTFFQIGMIYKVSGLKPSNIPSTELLKFEWIALEEVGSKKLAPFAAKALSFLG